MLRFDKATYLSLVFNSLWGSYFLLFSEFKKILSIEYYKIIEFIILLYTFLVISVAQYKEYMAWQISFSKVTSVLPALTCASALVNLLAFV